MTANGSQAAMCATCSFSSIAITDDVASNSAVTRVELIRAIYAARDATPRRVTGKSL